MTHAFDRAANVLLQWALAIMPHERRAWGRALAAEFASVPTSSERAHFAWGCLVFSISSWTRTRRGVVWIGRGLVAAGLWAMSAIGVTVALGLDGVPAFTLIFACLVYSIAGGIALLSLRVLWGYAFLGAVLAGAAWLYLGASSISWRSYYGAIAVEASALMAALVIASTVLMALRGARAGDV